VQITLDSIKRADEYNGADSLAEMADRYRYLLNASLFAYKLYFWYFMVSVLNRNVRLLEVLSQAL